MVSWGERRERGERGETHEDAVEDLRVGVR